ncbi:MAG: LysR family transcriptional regulator, partial [Planctomycetota bacterium]|nr:LysR family transcriptional regulator [Planctomycetota bacterium]
METTHLANFLILAQTSNMTRAAERVNLSQPALSGQLRKLEQELGTSLFHRQGRGLVLTAAGETFRSHAADILARLDAARSDLGMSGSLEGGAIAIGGGATAVSCLLPRVISQFRERHPGVRFSIKESPSRAIAEAVLSGELDLGIVTLPLPVTTAGSQLDTTPWLEDELVLLTP